MRTSIRTLAVSLILVTAAVAPVMAQQTYTNEDLEDFHIPGAYTNEDLEALEPLPVQEAPLFESEPADMTPWIEATLMLDAEYLALTHARDRLQAELDYELERIAIAYSPAGGGFTGSLRPGLRSKLEGKLEYLRRQIYMLDWEIDRLPAR